MLSRLFSSQKDIDKQKALETLIMHSSPRLEYFFLMFLSILMATFGLILNSSAVIIGSMLIAPVLFPILGIGMGVILSDGKLIGRSFYTLLKSILIAIGFATLTALFLMTNTGINGSEILERASPSLIHAAIAIVAGLAASFALTKPNLSVALPGVAVSVALVPPLAVTGIGIAKWNWPLIAGSFGMFTVNALGILFASMLVFSVSNFYVKRGAAERAIEKEDKEIKREEKDAEKVAAKVAENISGK